MRVHCFLTTTPVHIHPSLLLVYWFLTPTAVHIHPLLRKCTVFWPQQFKSLRSMLVYCVLTTTPDQIHPFLCWFKVFWSPHQFKSTRYYASVLFSDQLNSSNPPFGLLMYCFLTTTTVKIHPYCVRYCFWLQEPFKSTCYYACGPFSDHHSSNTHCYANILFLWLPHQFKSMC